MATLKKARKWRGVLVGCGGMSGFWTDAAQATPGVELVGLVDLKKEMAEKLATERKIKNVEIGTDLDAVLKKTKADLLFVCTVPVAHKPNILAGLRHGCHVLTEKPMTATMAEARAVIEAARKARKVVAVTQNYRYNRELRSLKKFLDSGKLGKVTGLDVDFYIGAHFGGFRDAMKHVLLLDMSIHPFDMSRFLADGANPVAVTATEWNPNNSWYSHGASALASFEFKNGVVFNYRGSWCSQGFDTDWNGSWRILCEKGSILWDGKQKIEAQVVDKRDGFIWPKKSISVPILPKKLFPVAHTAIMRNFVHCLNKGIQPETIITDNIHSLAMVHGAIESAEKGRRLTL